MELTNKLLSELQKRLKIGNRKGVHLNAIPGNSRYKFDVNRLAFIDKKLPDNFIQALLTEQPLKFKISWKDNATSLNALLEEDQEKLVKIIRSFENLINQTAAIESEKGINTFGFGFPLFVRRDKVDNELTVAPMLIWSLRVVRNPREFNTWEIIRKEGDPIYINEVLINHIESDQQVQVRQIPNEMLDDGLITADELIEICQNFLQAVNHPSAQESAEALKARLQQIKPIPPKKHYEDIPGLGYDNSMIEFGGLFSIFEVQKQSIIHDYDHLMKNGNGVISLDEMAGNSFQSISSVETDPSQQSVLHAMESVRNLLIQGPPGTGKSQTLTAVLINALENQKKTIVVCEKRTALEVLHQALIEKKLGNHCTLILDSIKDRKTVVDSVRNRVDDASFRHYANMHSKENLNSIIAKAKTLIHTINNKHKKLDKKLVHGESWTNIVGMLLAELDSPDADYSLDLGGRKFDFSTDEFDALLDLTQKGQMLYEKFEPFSALSFLNNEKLAGDNPFQIEQRIQQEFEQYAKKIDNIKEQERQYKKEYIKIRQAEFEAQVEGYNKISRSIKTISGFYAADAIFFDEKKTKGWAYKLTALFSTEKKKILNDQRKIKSLFSELADFLFGCKDLIQMEKLRSIQSNLLQLDELQGNIEEMQRNFIHKPEREYAALNVLEIAAPEYKTTSLTVLINAVEDLQRLILANRWVRLDPVTLNYDRFIVAVEELLKKKKMYFDHPSDLFTIEFNWFQFYNALPSDDKALLEKLKGKPNWRKLFFIYYLNMLLTQVADADLPTGDQEHTALNNVLTNLEEEQLKYISSYWYSRQVEARRAFEANHPDLSVANLYRKVSRGKNIKLSLRQLVQYDRDLFTAFFPVVLTTPDVCSNLFKGMDGYFDVILFDEASQLRLEDNLPALLKGKQVVVAGDEHQMPPSNYFSKVFDGSIEDEEDLEEEAEIYVDKNDILLACDSLLDFSAELNFEKKHLDFHYRSRHPYLIDFSNYAFYSKRLNPMPNVFDYTPIQFIQAEGVFSEHINDAEAENVLNVLENNIERLPDGKYPTVGIATLNIAQRNLIKSKILDRQRFAKYEVFNTKVQELEASGMFIKNLENIQGDERDVIILSTTYGVGKDGKFAQRFGPINHAKGYKLLNVIITRAKYKIYVCTSIPEKVFMNYREYLVVENANNKRAVFYAYLAYCKAVSENNNDLRLAVLAALKENVVNMKPGELFNEQQECLFSQQVYRRLVDIFGTDKLIAPLHFAGFHIDIVYDSKIEGLPKVAIECDGAKNHSSREAYVYDQHRKKILESHGFIFHRIWSANWWRNPQREMEKLKNFIQQSNVNISSDQKDHSKMAFAFTHEAKVPASPAISEGEAKIQLNSKVKLKYVNTGEEVKISIAALTPDKAELPLEFQAIGVQSALAISILGHIAGDVVKVGRLDHYVEIIEVIN